MQSMCAAYMLNGMCFCCIWLTIPFLRLITLSLQILRREEWRWCILLQMYDSLNTKIPNEAADWRLVTETLYIRTVGMK